MKEAYAVRRTVPLSTEIQADIDRLLGKGMVDDPQTKRSRFAGHLGDGASRTRTGDLLGAIQALSQLSYSPARRQMPLGCGTV